jgi:hypothetical protein
VGYLKSKSMFQSLHLNLREDIITSVAWVNRRVGKAKAQRSNERNIGFPISR